MTNKTPTTIKTNRIIRFRHGQVVPTGTKLTVIDQKCIDGAQHVGFKFDGYYLTERLDKVTVIR